MIRSFLPTDLIVILFQGGLLSNVARARDNLGEDRVRFLALAALLIRRLDPRVSRLTWVRTEGLSFRGLASVRDRCLPSAWDVDYLMLKGQDVRCCSSLLERLSSVGLDQGIKKIFLRLSIDSPFLFAAKGAGFSPYMTEHLYYRESGEGVTANDVASPPWSPRRKQASDNYRCFELYERRVPVSIRKVEGMTIREWEASREKRVGTEWVFEKEGYLAGWLELEANRDKGQFDIMAVSDEEMVQIGEYALKALDGSRRLFCLVPEFDQDLSRLLEERGFTEMGRYYTLVKELTAKESQPCLVPVRA